jgi:hypothetical protein
VSTALELLKSALVLMPSASERQRNKLIMAVVTLLEGRVTMHDVYDGEDSSADQGDMRALQPPSPCTDIHIVLRNELSSVRHLRSSALV